MAKSDGKPEAAPDMPLSTGEIKPVMDTAAAHPSPGAPTRIPTLTVIGGLIFSLALYGFLGLGIACIWSQTARDIMAGWWFWMIAAGMAGMAVAMWARQSTAGMFRLTSDTKFWLMFIALPLLTTLSAAIIALPRDYQVFAAKCIFLLVVCLLPGILYFLFIRTRRPSIFNEFLSNLNRFGLLDRRATPGREDAPAGSHVIGTLSAESESDLRRRLDGYFQRFEAFYGVLRFENPAWLSEMAAAIKGGNPQSAEFTRVDFVNCLVDETCRQGRNATPEAKVNLSDLFTSNVFIPIGFATVLGALGWILVLQPQWPLSESVSSVVGPPTPSKASSLFGSLGHIDMMPQFSPVSFAFIGAYFFGIQMIFRRFVRRDLGPNAIVAFSTRIVLAMMASWVGVAAYYAMIAQSPDLLQKALVAPLSDELRWPSGLLVLCFVLGVFPRILWQIVQALLAKLLRIIIPNVEAEQPLSQVDGLTVWHASRLEEEDIENVPNMATADIVDLMLHTQFPADRIVDWIDQSILLKALGSDTSSELKKQRRYTLRQHGIRTASGLVFAYGSRLQEGEDSDLAPSLDAALKEPGLGCIPTLVRTLTLEANFDLVYAWRRSGARGKAESTMTCPV